MNPKKQIYHIPHKETRIRNEASKQLRHQSVVYFKKGALKYSKSLHKQGYPWIKPCFSVKLPQENVEPVLTDKTLPTISIKRKPYHEEASKDVEAPVVFPKVRKHDQIEQVLLRRPTPELPPPILESEDSFQTLATSLNLRSIIIDQSQSKTFDFYKTHFPLLLEKSIGEDREKIINKRNFVKETPQQVALKRNTEIHEKLEELHAQIQVLDDEMTDGDFCTELRRQIFDPRVWKWNKERYFQPVNDFYNN